MFLFLLSLMTLSQTPVTTDNISAKKIAAFSVNPQIDLDDIPALIKVNKNGDLLINPKEGVLSLYDGLTGKIKLSTPSKFTDLLFPISSASENDDAFMLTSPLSLQWFSSDTLIPIKPLFKPFGAVHWECLALPNLRTKYLAAIENVGGTGETYYLKLWHFDTEKFFWIQKLPNHVSVKTLAFNPDQTILVMGCDGFVAWDKDLKDFKVDPRELRGVDKSFQKSMSELASAGLHMRKSKETLVFIETQTKKIIKIHEGKFPGNIRFLKISPCGKYLAYTCVKRNLFPSENINEGGVVRNENSQKEGNFDAKLVVIRMSDYSQMFSIEASRLGPPCFSNDGKYIAFALSQAADRVSIVLSSTEKLKRAVNAKNFAFPVKLDHLTEDDCQNIVFDNKLSKMFCLIGDIVYVYEIRT